MTVTTISTMASSSLFSFCSISPHSAANIVNGRTHSNVGISQQRFFSRNFAGHGGTTKLVNVEVPPTVPPFVQLGVCSLSYASLYSRCSVKSNGTRAKREKLSWYPHRQRYGVMVRCQKVSIAIPPLKQLTISEPTPVLTFAKAFAPATVANLGPGYDFLGCAVDGLGDFVTAEVSDSVPPGTVAISSITGDEGRLSYVSGENCAGIAGKATLDLLGVESVGVSLKLHKGLPLGSGLGSSAASAAAAAVAVNALFGSPLSKEQLVQAGLESEATVSGYHADNVAPSLMGGFVLIRRYNPLHLVPLLFPKEKKLFFVLVSPDFEAPTKTMRAVLPLEISMQQHVSNCSEAAALVSAIILGDARLLGSALSSDTIVEPKRGPLVPGLLAVKLVSLMSGAYGCTISGAGPTMVAITDTEEMGHEIGASMVKEFWSDGKLKAKAFVQKLDREGARVVDKQ